MICKRCGKQFFENYSKYGSGKYCSSLCSHARKLDSVSKNKISNSLHRYNKAAGHSVYIIEENKICKNCNKPFILKIKNSAVKFRKGLYCCRKCASIANGKIIRPMSQEQKIKLSITRKQMFKDGKLKVTGGTTRWIQYNKIKVQGTYELRTCFILDKMKQLNIIKNWSYAKDRIDYFDINNEKHTYIIDFKILNNDNSFYYIQVKGRIRENDEIKWKTVKQNGYKIEIWFIDTIKKYEKIYQLSSAGRAVV